MQLVYVSFLFDCTRIVHIVSVLAYYITSSLSLTSLCRATNN